MGPADATILGLLVEHAPDGLLLVDDAGVIVFANAEIERLFGHPRGELVGQRVELLVPDAGREAHAAHRARYREAPARRPMGVGRELVGRRRDGGELPVDVSLSPLDVDGRPHVVAAVRDVSTQRRAAADAAHAERETAAEREAGAFSRIAEGKSATVTATAYGAAPLHQAAPEAFAGLVARYEELLDRALEQRAYRVDAGVSEGLRALVEPLGFLFARPRDLVEIHTRAVASRTRGASPRKAAVYAEEGRLLLLELMGHLASHYRRRSLGAAHEGERRG
jgi:PAS domain S-box-containing protein